MFSYTPTGKSYPEEFNFDSDEECKKPDPNIKLRIKTGIDELKKAGIYNDKNVSNLEKNANHLYGIFGDNIAGCFQLAEKFKMPAQQMFDLLIANAPYVAGLDHAFIVLNYHLKTRDNFLKIVQVIRFADEIGKEIDRQSYKIDRNYGGIELGSIRTQEEFDAIINQKRMKIKLNESKQIILFKDKEGIIGPSEGVKKIVISRVKS